MWMHHRLQIRQPLSLILFLFCIGMVPATAGASTLTTLVDLPAPFGSNPLCRLTQGNDGNFYGGAVSGGAHGAGTIYKLTPSGTFKDTLTVTLP